MMQKYYSHLTDEENEAQEAIQASGWWTWDSDASSLV